MKANKATKKLIKKGALGFASRVHTSKRGGAKRGGAAGGRQALDKFSGGRGRGGFGGGGRGGRGGRGGGRGGRSQGGGGGYGGNKGDRRRSGDEEEDGKGEGEADAEGEEAATGDAIENMDVDSFMRAGMFGAEDAEAEEDDADEEEKEGEEEDVEEEVNGSKSEKKAKKVAKEEEDGSSDEEDDEDEQLKDEVKKHKAELERLKAKDPEFFKFLEKTDGNLLNFGRDEEDEEEEGEEEQEGEEDGEEEGEKGEEDDDDAMEEQGEEDDEEEGDKSKNGTKGDSSTRKGPKELTLEMLSTIERAALEQHSVKALRRLILAFKAASHMADETSKGGRSTADSQHYTIASSAVFDRLLVTCLTSLPEAFGHHLLQDSDYNPTDPAPFAKLPATPAFRSLRPLVYRALKALLYLLGQITEPSLLAFTLSRLERFIPFLIPFTRQAKLYLKTLLNLWATSDALNVKLTAFLRIRQAATVLPFPFLEHALKGLYLAYVRSAKFVTETSLPGLTLMGNCMVELYGLDMTSSYQHAFVYLRQLALHLRAAYTKKTPETLQKVHSWQYLNCLKVWVAILTAYPGPEQLRDLIFALTQIILGLVKLVPSARHYPLVLHCITLLQRLAAKSQVFIPCASTLLDMLENPALLKKPKATTDAPPNLAMTTKLGKELLDPRNVQETVVNEVMEILGQEILIYRYTIAFPEYSFPIKDRLKRFSKAIKASRWRALCRGLIEDIEKRSSYVEKERTKRELAPTDAIVFEALRPVGEVDAAERLKAALDAKAKREGLAVATISASSMVEGKRKEVREEEEDEEEVKGKGAVEDGKKKQKQAVVAKIPALQLEVVESMEDEVGGLDEWSSSSDDEEEDGEGMEEEEEEEDDEEEE